LICSEEINILETDLLKRKLHMRNPSENIIDSFRNKLVMKRLVYSGGILIPKFMEIDQEKLKHQPDLLFKEMSDFLGLPFVVKPIDQFCTIGVYKIKNFEDFS
jgi:biotin carboxylase